MESRSQILQKFLNVAEHTEQCYNFEIQYWLEKYEQCHEKVNFSEAAFLIFSAAKIYGRKVDYLEQILLDFNQASAASVAKAIADKQKEMDDAEVDKSKKDKKDKKKNESEKQREKEKEKALKRAKRMQKVTNQFEFKPKPFSILPQSQISLNIHEQPNEMDDDEEFENLRLKNIFPRINILQSNLQCDNSFYDNLGIVEKNCDNLDSLRDFRIFMDTIDEPLNTGRSGKQSNFAVKYDSSQKRQKHCNAYLSAQYIKENYGVEMKDNSDYLNMIRYDEEVVRLNLRNLNIEQLGKLKIGTYLNNILHGNKQNGTIPEYDSGIGSSERDSIYDTSHSIHDATDLTMMDSSINNTSVEENSLNISCIPADTSLDLGALSLDVSKSIDESDMDPNSDASTSLEVSKLCENLDEKALRQSLDDGLGSSLIHSPVRMNDLDTFERTMMTPMVEVRDILYPMNKYGEIIGDISIDVNGPMKDILDSTEAMQRGLGPVLEVNIFKISETLLRRPKIFKLTREFHLWLAARKRKSTTKADLLCSGKLLKLSSGHMIRADADSDNEELLGFDENNQFKTAPSATFVIDETNPATIQNRSFSSDSGIINAADTIETINLPDSTINDSGVIVEENNTENCNDSIASNRTGQEMDASGANINANSTQFCNDSQSVMVSEMDSGFAESVHGNLQTFSIEEIQHGLSFTIAGENDDSVLEADELRKQQQQQEEENRNEDLRDMVERVGKWHEMLTPILKNSEKRNNFDIHALGTDIIDLFPQERDESTSMQLGEPSPPEITFSNVMENRDQTYTARYFLSLLLLTNNKNVQLSVEHPERNGKELCLKDDLKIKLLSRSRHLDEVNKINEHLQQPISWRSKSITSSTIHDVPRTSGAVKKTTKAKKRKLESC